MRSTASKPVFQSVLDLGLRDVGVEGDPRRSLAHAGKAVLRLFPVAFTSFVAICLLVHATGAHAWLILPLLVPWGAAHLLLVLRAVRRGPVMVLKVNAEGSNQVTWLLLASHVPLVLSAVILREPVAMALVGVVTVVSLIVLRSRGRVPEMLRRFRPLLATGETVLGDGVGLARAGRRASSGLRLIAATDGRLLVTGPARSEPFLLVDARYRDVSRFGIEWRNLGLAGTLSVTVGGETYTIGSIAPANLLSIALALRSHGVAPDDPDAISEAERGWRDALRRDRPRTPLLDRGAMSTRAFDRGLWLLLGLSAVTFYLNPFGVGFGASRDASAAVLVIVLVLSAVSGYVARTRSSLAYVVPLNLLLIPAFLFADARVVINVMVALSAVAAGGLLAGSAARRGAGAGDAQAPRGRLRRAISGRSLIRLSAVLLGLVLVSVVTASAFGFEVSTLRLAVDEATKKQLPVDGRSNLTGNAASFRYTPGPGLHELVTDEHWGAGPNDGARWELRSSWRKGYNVVSLAHYVFEPPLDDPAAVAAFVAGKDAEHSRLAGFRVTHTTRVVDGRTGYVWDHEDRRGYHHYVAWFPQPEHTVRVECISRRQKDRFRRLCAEAIGSLRFH
jgi:hypothetical protein